MSLELIKQIDKEWTFSEDDLPEFEKGDVFIRKEDWDNIKTQEEKNKILEPIFIASEEANKEIIVRKNKEQLELKKIISRQKDLIISIPEILAKVTRQKDKDGTNELLKEVFQEFCKAMDNHGVSYNNNKLKMKIYFAKNRLEKLENKLESEQDGVNATEEVTEDKS